jgi:multiple sugar transport system permease protein
MSTTQTGPRETLRELGYASEMEAARQSPELRQPVRRTRRHPEKWLAHLGLLIVCVGFILPFVWMVSTSLKTADKAMAFPPRFVPDQVEIHHLRGLLPVPKNYVDVVMHPRVDFPLYTRNTLLIAALSVVGTTLSSAVVAYGFSKIRFRGRGFLFALMLSTMMIPFPVVMVSLFSIFRWIGDHTAIQMLGTFKPLWLPAWFGSAFNIFLLRQFFMTLPDELSEAARIDGCSEWGIFCRIVLPLARPALAVVALFTFMGVWNDFLGPLVYIQRPQQYTLALGLQTFQSQHGGTEMHLLMAASVLVICPIILLFFVTQRTFIQGIATTGMKG